MRRVLLVLLLGTMLSGCGKPITIIELRERDFVQHVLDSQPQTQGKSKVSIDNENNIVIEIDVTVSDPAAFKASLENIRKGTSDYIRREARPFIVKTQNQTFTLK